MKRVIILVLVVMIVLAINFIEQMTYKYYKKQIKRIESNIDKVDTEIISINDLKDLPEAVRNYLNLVGVVGTEKVKSFSPIITGSLKMDKEKDWAKVNIEQVSYIDNPIRLFYISMRFFALKIVGLHHYESAKATMIIKILDLIKVADAKGIEMDQGETVTVFNDMCVLAPGSLIDNRIKWKEIDDYTVEGTFTNNDITVSSTLYFNEKGELINFVSDDRYHYANEDDIQSIRWSTPVGEYKKMENGLYQASYGEAIWLMDDGPFKYAKFNIDNVVINP